MSMCYGLLWSSVSPRGSGSCPPYTLHFIYIWNMIVLTHVKCVSTCISWVSSYLCSILGQLPTQFKKLIIKQISHAYIWPWSIYFDWNYWHALNILMRLLMPPMIMFSAPQSLQTKLEHECLVDDFVAFHQVSMDLNLFFQYLVRGRSKKDEPLEFTFSSISYYATLFGWIPPSISMPSSRILPRSTSGSKPII